MLDLTSIPQLARNASRLGEIVRVLAKYGLAGWLARLDRKFVHRMARRTPLGDLTTQPRVVRVRLTLTELGTTFIKLGQVLSTRRDLVGHDLADELRRLQTGVPADPFEATRATVERELGRPVAELFAHFDETPLASASIAQVHRATLHDGRQVVVKVQHPDIERRIAADLSILAELAKLAEAYLPDARAYRPVAVVGEFKRSIGRELDFGREVRHLQLFRNAFAADRTVRFPEPYPGFSTARVLTMEYLAGVPFTDPGAVRAAGGDLDALTVRGANLFLEMIFREGVFHADPHPGNVLFLPGVGGPGGAIGLIDFGMVGRVDDETRGRIERGVAAAVRKDAAGLADVLVQLGEVPPNLDRAAFQGEVAEQLAFYWGMPLSQFRLGPALDDLADAVRRFQVVLPASLAMLLRVLVMLEGAGRTLSPKFDLVPLLSPYARAFVLRRLSPKRLLRNAAAAVGDWDELARTFPRQMSGLMRALGRQEVTVRLSHRHLDPSVNRLAFGLMCSALFLGSSFMWAMKAPPVVFGEVSIFGVVGTVVSGVLGFRLFRAIQHSGRLDDRE